MSPRAELFEAIGAMLERELGPQSEGKTFRTVRVGQWIPSGPPAPALTVIDAGSKDSERWPGGDGQIQTQEGGTRTLSGEIWLDLPGNWDAGYGAWQDVVEEIICMLALFRPAGLGVVTSGYTSDDPMTAVLDSGESREVWIISFDVEVSWAMSGEQE